MAILHDNSIEKLVTGPEKILGNDYDLHNIQGASYDLRIGTIYKNDSIISVDRDNNCIVKILPSEITTMLTFEKVNIPRTMCASVFPINSMSSIGLLILNPGHIDPGYNGYISICAINLSNVPIFISLKDPIFTIVFFVLDGTAKEFPNHYKLSERKDIEFEQYKRRASKLSPSIFDLITIKEYSPYLKEQIKTVLNNRIGHRLVHWTSTATIIALLVACISLYRQNQNTIGSTTTSSSTQSDTLKTYKTISFKQTRFDLRDLNK